VKKSQEQYGGTRAIFPTRQDPQVVPYSIKKTYGKANPSPGAKAVFFCYAMPAPPGPARNGEQGEWTEEAGDTKWYLFDLADEKIADGPTEIVRLIRSGPNTPRKHDIPNQTLSEIRAKVEKHIKNTYLKQVQAPIGVKARMKVWMELS
jgi:hypothetical protein